MARTVDAEADRLARIAQTNRDQAWQELALILHMGAGKDGTELTFILDFNARLVTALRGRGVIEETTDG